MATRYWVGGDGEWHDTAHWSTSSGGAGGSSAPTSSDDVIIDANSYPLTTITFTGQGTCHNFTNDKSFGVNNGISPLAFSGDKLTVTGTFLFKGFGLVANNYSYAILESATYGVPFYIDAAVVDIDSVHFMDIVAGGAAAPWTGTRLGDYLGNSGITFDASRTLYWVCPGGAHDTSRTANWSTTSGGAGNAVPMPQDDVVFDANSGTNIPRIILDYFGRNLDATNSLFTTGIMDDIVAIYGNIALSSHRYDTAGFDLRGRGNHTITTNGGCVGTLFINSAGGTYTLQDNLDLVTGLSVGVNFTIYSGNFDANNYNLKLYTFTCNTASVSTVANPQIINYADNITVNFGTGTWTITGSTGTALGEIWHTEQGSRTITLNNDNCHILFQPVADGASGSPLRIYTNFEITLHNVEFRSFGGTITEYKFTNTANITFGIFKLSNYPLSVTLASGQTYFATSFIVAGTSASEIITLTSVAESFLSVSNHVIVSYINVKNNHALGAGILFDASTGGVDQGGNTNWCFTGNCNGAKFLQTVLLVGSDPDGDVQLVNAGKDDDGTPIYYELETQELDFGNRIIKKNIKDKIVVFTENAIDSKLQIREDDNDFKDIQIDLGKRVSVASVPKTSLHYTTLRWSGNVINKQPILEGFYFNQIEDESILNN